MDFTQRISLVLIAALALLAASGLRAQEPPQNPDAAAGGGSNMTRYAEVMRAQRVLMSLLSQATGGDPGLNQLRVQFEKVQREAMVALDPATSGRLERMAELQTLYEEIGATEERPDVGALLDEGRQLRRKLQATAVQARKRPGVAARATAFANALETRFRQIDPESFETHLIADTL